MVSKKGDNDLKGTIRNLEKEKQLLESIVNSSGEWEMLLDKRRNVLYLSPSFEVITGYKSCLLTKNSSFLHSIIHPEDIDTFLKLERKTVAQNFRSASSSVRIITKNKKIKWIKFQCSNLYDKKRKYIGLRFTNKDVTDLKEAEKRSKENEQKYKLLSEISSDDGSLLILHEDGTISREWSINKLSKRYGYRKDEINSIDSWLKKIHPEDHEKFLQQADRLKLGASISTQLRLITNSDEQKWILSTLKLIKKSAKKLEILCSAKDITEFKKAEQALIDSEKRYRLLSQITTDDGSSLILQEDGTMKREWHIDTLFKKFGYHPSEIDSIEKWLQFVHPDDKNKIINALTLLKQGKTICEQFRIFTKSGEIKWIQDTIQPSIDPQTKRLRLLSAVKDITDYKKTELSFLDNEEKFKAIFNTIDVGIIQSNGTGGFDVVNDSWVDMLGYTREELKELKIYDVIFTEDLRKEFDVFNDAVKQCKTRYVLDKRFVRKDGSVILCRSTQFIIYDEYRTVKQVLSLVHDITEQRKAELALLESEKKYRNLTENIDDIVCKCDADFNILFINKAIEKYNFTPDDFVGKNLSDLNLPKDLLTYLDELLQIVIKTKKTSQTTVKYCMAGRDIYFSCRFHPEFDTPEKVSHIHCICSEITDLIKVEQELIKAKEKAEESDRLKSIFLANMSHEIRTPMNAIVGFATLLENDNLPPETKKKYVEIINNSAENLLTIINDILDISKIEAGQMEICEAPFNLHQILRDVHEQIELHKKIKGKGDIEIILSSDCSGEFIIFSDEVRIQQVLTNLLNNALKFIQKGHIEFGYNKVDVDNKVFLQFHVKDTGIGIAEDKKKIIFERFRQEEESIHASHDGTGLGLAICKGILDIMGGSIWVDTKKREGTIFYFRIPLHHTNFEEPEKKEIKSQITSDFIFINKTILIVDDTTEIHQYFSEVLSKTGAHLLHAINAKETLQFIESKTTIDIILMDIRLPDMNGLELTKIIKKTTNIPIVAQTAFALSSDRQQILDTGCDDYITKPIDRLQLLMCLSKFLYDKKPLW